MTDKINTALLFAGQGAQSIGMGKDFHDAFEPSKKMFEAANQALGFSLTKFCFEGPQEELNRTDVCQPALLVSALAGLEFFNSQVNIEKLNIVTCAGLSLGEYTALAYSGVISFDEAVKLVKLRGQYMQEACNAAPGTMASVIGLDETKVSQACADARSSGTVVISNYNATDQIVISGDKAAVEKASEHCKTLGAKRVIPLKVAGAYHSPLMSTAQLKMETLLKNTKFNASKIPVVSNVTATTAGNSDEIRTLLGKQVTSAVKWDQSVKAMVGMGVKVFLEFGPGKVLTGMIKRGYPDVRAYSFEKTEDVKNFNGLASW